MTANVNITYKYYLRFSIIEHGKQQQFTSSLGLLNRFDCIVVLLISTFLFNTFWISSPPPVIVVPQDAGETSNLFYHLQNLF